MLDEAFDKFEDTMRKDTIGDEAHQKLFAVADELEAKDPVKYKEIIERCRNGHYHDFATKVAFPKMEMHTDLLAAGLNDVDERIQNGEFDS
jgi:hypothetical protein